MDQLTIPAIIHSKNVTPVPPEHDTVSIRRLDIKEAERLFKDIYEEKETGGSVDYNLERLYRQVARFIQFSLLYENLKFFYGEYACANKRYKDRKFPNSGNISRFKSNRVKVYLQAEEKLAVKEQDNKTWNTENAWKEYLLKHSAELFLSEDEINDGISRFQVDLQRRRDKVKAENETEGAKNALKNSGGRNLTQNDMEGFHVGEPTDADPSIEGREQKTMESQCQLQ